MINVVMIDDHKLVRAGIANLIEANTEIKVVEQFDAPDELISLDKDLCYDVAIVDISMPGIGGIKATQILAEKNRKVIMLSMHQTTFHVAAAMKVGAKGFVGKSSPIEDLYSAIHVVYQGGIWIPHEISKAIILDLIKHSEASSQFSPRQIEVLKLTMSGLKSKEIAYELGVSTKTIETYKHQIMEKAGVNDITALVKWSILNGFTGF